jgi:hypothetical protein
MPASTVVRFARDTGSVPSRTTTTTTTTPPWAQEARGREVLRDRPPRALEGRYCIRARAVATGVDIKGVVAVLQMEQPYGLVDFIQQTGRRGRRDGETVDSVVIVSSAPAWFDETSGDIEQVNREAVERYIKTPDCRRVTIGAFMDRHVLKSAADESRIGLVARAVDPVIARCEATMQTSGRTALCWLRSVSYTYCHRKPFILVGKKATRTRYITYRAYRRRRCPCTARSFLGGCWRALWPDLSGSVREQ